MLTIQNIAARSRAPLRGCDAWLDVKAVLMEEVCIILTLFH